MGIWDLGAASNTLALSLITLSDKFKNASNSICLENIGPGNLGVQADGTGLQTKGSSFSAGD